jgi:hypothetical protein
VNLSVRLCEMRERLLPIHMIKRVSRGECDELHSSLNVAFRLAASNCALIGNAMATAAIRMPMLRTELRSFLCPKMSQKTPEKDNCTRMTG